MRKSTFKFVMSVGPSARTEHFVSKWKDFNDFIFLENISRNLKVHYNVTSNNALYMNTNTHFLSYHSPFYPE